MPTSIRTPKPTMTTRATSVSLFALVLAVALPDAVAAQTGELAPLPAETGSTVKSPPEIMDEVADRFAELNATAAEVRETYDACMGAAAVTASSAQVTAEMRRTGDAPIGAGGTQALNESLCALSFYEKAVEILGDSAQTHLRAQQGLEASLAGFTAERATHEAARAAAEAAIAESRSLRESLVLGFAEEAKRILAIPEEARSDADKTALANFQIDLQLVGLDLTKNESLRSVASSELDRLGAAESLISAWAMQSGLTARKLTVDIRLATNSIEVIKAGASAEARADATRVMLEIVERTSLDANPFPDMPVVPLPGFAEAGGFEDIARPDLGATSRGEADLAAVFAAYGIDVTSSNATAAEATAPSDGGQ